MSSYNTNIHSLMKTLQQKAPDPLTLVSKNAGKAARQLFEYLHSIYGKHILAGQQYLQHFETEDAVYYGVTGRLPAVRGYDLLDMNKPNDPHSQTERAIRWAKNSGCIITMCWHWYAPDDLQNPDNTTWSFYYKTTDYDRKTSFDILKAVRQGTAEYEFAVNQIDKAAGELKKLEKENIPVLWRPLHEAAGNWFWWGNRGNDGGESAAAYKKLWYMIFDRLENYHKLSNLIWVWNGQSKEMAVDPNTYDIVGEDIYPPPVLGQDHSAQKEKFLEVTSYTGGKMAALSECGYIPDPDGLKKENVKWLWWLPWWGSFVYETNEHHRPVFDEKGLPRCNPERFSPELLKSYFDNEYCLTLDKLPWFSHENDNYVRSLMKERFGL